MLGNIGEICIDPSCLPLRFQPGLPNCFSFGLFLSLFFFPRKMVYNSNLHYLQNTYRSFRSNKSKSTVFFVGMPLFELMVLRNDSFPSDRMWGRKRQRQGWGEYGDAELVTSLNFTASVAMCTHNRTAVNEAVS